MSLKLYTASRRWSAFIFARFFCSEHKNLKYSYSFTPGTTILSHATLGELVDIAADKVPDKPAFISPHQNVRKTFSEFKKSVDSLASGLLSLGLCKGDRLGLCVPNIYEWPVVQFAAAKAGLILVNINPACQPNELEYFLTKVGCAALIATQKFKTQNFYEIMCSIMPELPSGHPKRLQSAKFKNLRSVILIGEEIQSGILNFDEVLNSGNLESKQMLGKMENLIQFDDPVNIQFTSGTTGHPKGATLSHHNVINNALTLGRRMRYHSQAPTLCCQVPLFHCFGCVVGSLASVLFQFPCVFPSAGYDVNATLKAIEDQKCTVLYGTPTMFIDLINRYDPNVHNTSTLKQVLIGGAPGPETMFEDLYKKMRIPYVHHTYGCTENSPVITVTDLDDDQSAVLTRYMPAIDYAEMKVINEEGHVIPIECKGELCSRGHMIFTGYWGQDGKTAEVVDKSRWYHTGDLALMNKDGRVKIVGRKKDIVIRGGENLYPIEIEHFLSTNPAIMEVHICGVPDNRMGEELCAWIKLKHGESLTEDKVKEFCKGKISHYKVPRYIQFVDDFPKTTSGKIQKFKMRELSLQRLKL